MTDETETSPSSPVVGMSNSQLPTVESGKRSNSLGLGFSQDIEEEEERRTPTMLVASPNLAPVAGTMASDGSPTTMSSGSSVANLEEDNKAFQETKAAVNPSHATQE